MEEAVRFLLDNPEKRRRMGEEAYKTITGLWNAEHGAAELLRMIEETKNGKYVPPKDGPLSAAPVISPGGMYERMMKGAI